MSVAASKIELSEQLYMLDVPTRLAILGVVIGSAGYVCKRVTVAFERAKKSLEDAIEAYQGTTQHHTTQLGQLSQGIQLETVHHQMSPTSDFKPAILQDALRVKHAESIARQSSENVSRLIEKLMFGREPFRKEFERLNAAFDNTILQHPIPPNPNWTHAATSKIAVLSTTFGSIPMLFFADQVITTAKKRIALLDSVVRSGRLMEWFLYIAGISLTFYGLVKGIKIPGGSE
jgi:hypothetical protein